MADCLLVRVIDGRQFGRRVDEQRVLVELAQRFSVGLSIGVAFDPRETNFPASHRSDGFDVNLVFAWLRSVLTHTGVVLSRTGCQNVGRYFWC